MKFFIDTANIDEIRKGMEMGLVDGVTTNPSLLAKEKKDPEMVLHEILKTVPGPVSLEVISTDAKGMIEEARKLADLGENAVIKIPMTENGIKAVRTLTHEGIKTNVTLIFQPLQALIAAKAGATYVSPFIGRLDDISQRGWRSSTVLQKYFTTTRSKQRSLWLASEIRCMSSMPPSSAPTSPRSRSTSSNNS